MQMGSESFVVAAAQVAPVYLNRDATIAKACEQILETGRRGARLVVFPEAFVPAYPDWIWAVPPGEGGVLSDLYAALVENSVAVPDEATERLGEAARAAGCYVAIGINERNAEASGASIYNTLLYIDDAGRIVGKHRKLVPTAAERLVWTPGDGGTLETFRTPLGVLGGLVCWENYMPLARYAMYAGGAQIFVAATWDRGDVWQATVRHIAREGGMYVISCCMPLRRSDLPDGLRERFYAGRDEWINVGNSIIADPNGDVIAGPLHQDEGILYAEIDVRRTREAKWMLDVAGHYARPDIFDLTVDRRAHEMMRSLDPPDLVPGRQVKTAEAASVDGSDRRLEQR